MDPEFSKEIHFVKRFWPIAIMCVMYVCVYIYILFFYDLFDILIKGSWEAILPSYEWLLLDAIDYDEGW